MVRVVVVGAGISGLTCALRLREAGHEVDVVAAHATEQTTSAVAAALWYPYRALPQDEVTRWAGITYRVLSDLATRPETGVRLRQGRELFRAGTPDPWWRDAVPALERVPADDLPHGYADGVRLAVPVVDMPVHLPWLTARLRHAGVEVQHGVLERLEDAAPDADVVVNCAGLGAADLVADDAVTPVRGQVVVVEQVGVEEWLLAQEDEARLTYVVPRQRTVVLGGTADVGRADVDPDPATARAIVQRCTRLVPALSDAPVVAHKVGVRPARTAVRVEPGRLATGQRVVHDYGHGGAGVTLSYGCAQDVVDLVAAG